MGGKRKWGCWDLEREVLGWGEEGSLVILETNVEGELRVKVMVAIENRKVEIVKEAIVKIMGEMEGLKVFLCDWNPVLVEAVNSIREKFGVKMLYSRHLVFNYVQKTVNKLIRQSEVTKFMRQFKEITKTPNAQEQKALLTRLFYKLEVLKVDVSIVSFLRDFIIKKVNPEYFCQMAFAETTNSKIFTKSSLTSIYPSIITNLKDFQTNPWIAIPIPSHLKSIELYRLSLIFPPPTSPYHPFLSQLLQHHPAHLCYKAIKSIQKSFLCTFTLPTTSKITPFLPSNPLPLSVYEHISPSHFAYVQIDPVEEKCSWEKTLTKGVVCQHLLFFYERVKGLGLDEVRIVRRKGGKGGKGGKGWGEIKVEVGREWGKCDGVARRYKLGEYAEVEEERKLYGSKKEVNLIAEEKSEVDIQQNESNLENDVNTNEINNKIDQNESKDTKSKEHPVKKSVIIRRRVGKNIIQKEVFIE
jgi:hypothetical protein